MSTATRGIFPLFRFSFPVERPGNIPSWCSVYWGISDCPLCICAQQNRGEVHEEALAPISPDSNMLEVLSSSLCDFSPWSLSALCSYPIACLRMAHSLQMFLLDISDTDISVQPGVSLRRPSRLPACLGDSSVKICWCIPYLPSSLWSASVPLHGCMSVANASCCAFQDWEKST